MAFATLAHLLDGARTPDDRLDRDDAVELLKPNDVARQLAVSRSWVYEAASAGRIPFVRIGGESGPLRFVPEDIDAWLADSRATWVPGARSGVDRQRRADSRARRAGETHTPRTRSVDGDQQLLL